MSTCRIPKYRHYRPKNLGMVVIRGKAHYLGKFGTKESWEKYRRLIAEYLAVPTPSPAPQAPDQATKDSALTIDELVIAFWDRHVTSYSVKGGAPTSKQDNIRQALRFLSTHYGCTTATGFGPKALILVRDAMVQAGRCRTLINKDVNRIRSMFRWAVEKEMYPGTAYQDLRAVKGLAKGRGGAKERPPVAPVSLETVGATLPFLPQPVGVMVKLQLFTGARPGEITALRPRDLDRSDAVAWVYRPNSHKTEHHGLDRTIFLGPQAQKILVPWLDRDPDQYCFRPVEAAEARNARQRAQRRNRSGASQGGYVRRPSPKRVPGERYGKDAYRWAIRRACVKAGVPCWTPHQLRHTRATQIRSEYGIEAAQLILGHSRLDTTEIYAERDLAKAREIMAKIG